MSESPISGLILNSPVVRALAEIGDRWVCLIIRDVFLGVRKFEELRKCSGAARGTPTSRLKSMVESGILYKKLYQSAPTRYEYRLTEKGLDLYPCVLAVWAWETEWSSESHIPPVLTHTLCGKDMRPVFRCSVCCSPIQMQDVTIELGQPPGNADKIPARFQRRSSSNSVSKEGVDRRIFHVLDIIGDRWTGLVLAAHYFGLKRFDEIANALGIATNILTDRLKLLVSVGVLQRVPYQDKPLRHEYRLSDKGAALYSNALQMHEWANKWLIGKDEESMILNHRKCQARLTSELVCSACEQILKASEVTFDPMFEGLAGATQ